MQTTHRPNQTLFERLQAMIHRLACLLGTLLLGACASTSAPTANEQTHVTKVEIIQHDAAAATFGDTLREAVLRQAALYGDAGRPITLRIEITRLHFKNAVQNLIIGDNNYVYGKVGVIDPATGQQTSTFTVKVDDRKGGLASAGFAVVTLVDPTGLISKSVGLNHSSTAAALSSNFATETLRQTYGAARAKAVAKTH